jgi:hypothetical protein
MLSRKLIPADRLAESAASGLSTGTESPLGALWWVFHATSPPDGYYKQPASSTAG